LGYIVGAYLVESFFQAVCKIRLRDSGLRKPKNSLPQELYEELIDGISSPRGGPNVYGGSGPCDPGR